jgi:RNA polymerase-binding transcription factor DksA
MTDQQIAHFKRKLLAEKKRAMAELSDFNVAEESGASVYRRTDVADSDSNDRSDQASELYDRDRQVAAKDNVTNILAKIERALQKIDEGTYGQSDVDGSPIPVERLEVLPYALTTVDQEGTL